MRLGLVLVLFTGCYDPILGQPVGGDTEVVTGFPGDVEAVFSASCAGSGCHWGGSMNPKLSEGYDAVVGVASTAGPDYITAGDSAGSYLVAKLKGTHTELGGSGSQMPLGTPLTEAEIATITAWVDAGAVREE